MPIYEYDCQKCHERTEVIQGYSDPPLKICPHCGGKKLKKAFSAPAIQFKGSGWYVTDYGKGDSGPRKKETDSPAKTDGSGKTESAGKSESADKSETKADSGSGDTAKTGAEKKTEKKKGKKGE
jgi:putative FmdB family regulatory protein